MILVISTPSSGGSWICQKLLLANSYTNYLNVKPETNKNSVLKYVNSISNCVVEYGATNLQTQADYDLLDKLINSAEEIKVVVRRDFNAQIKSYYSQAYLHLVSEDELSENANTIFSSEFEDAETISVADWEAPYYLKVRYDEKKFGLYKKLIHFSLDRQLNIVKQYDLYDNVLYIEDETDFESAGRALVWTETLPVFETHLINLFDKNYVQD